MRDCVRSHAVSRRTNRQAEDYTGTATFSTISRST
jgi:hypothetical protein